MTTTTFGYDAMQDRIWMRSHQPDITLWFTRRMVERMIGPMLKAFTDSTPGLPTVSPAEQRVALEHDLALHETEPGTGAAQIRPSKVQPGEDADPQQRLCHRVTTHTDHHHTQLAFETPAGGLNIQLSRQAMHLWLRGLVMTLRTAQWPMPPEVPDWLRSDMLPEAVRRVVNAVPGAPPLGIPPPT